jgi:hypothetical protein
MGWAQKRCNINKKYSPKKLRLFSQYNLLGFTVYDLGFMVCPSSIIIRKSSLVNCNSSIITRKMNSQGCWMVSEVHIVLNGQLFEAR